MTYADLKEILDGMTESELRCNVVAYNEEENEYYSLNSFGIADESCDRLDFGHPYLYFYV